MLLAVDGRKKEKKEKRNINNLCSSISKSSKWQSAITHAASLSFFPRGFALLSYGNVYRRRRRTPATVYRLNAAVRLFEVRFGEN